MPDDLQHVRSTDPATIWILMGSEKINLSLFSSEGETSANADAQKAAKSLATVTEHHRRQQMIITALQQEQVRVDEHIT